MFVCATWGVDGGDEGEKDWGGISHSDEAELTRNLVQKFWTHVQFQEEFAASDGLSRRQQAGASSSSSSNGTADGPEARLGITDKTIFKVRALGRRGRLYDDVWSEQDFLLANEMSASQGATGRRCIESWCQLLKHYHDDHDGPYVDWLIEEHVKARRSAAARGQERDRTAAVHLSSSGVGTRRTGTVMREISVLPETSLRAPPVPVSVQHPASWGPGSRYPLQEHCTVDVDVIHPACASTTLVYPVGRTLGKHSGSEAGGTVGSKRRRTQMECSDEELDEMSIHVDEIVRQLEMQMAANYVLLSRVIASAKRQMSIQLLREKERQMQATAVAVLSCINGFKDALLEHTMINKFGKEAGSSSTGASARRQAGGASDRHAKHNHPGLPLVGAVRMTEKGGAGRAARTPEQFTGATRTEHLSHGDFLRSLRIDSLVEVYGIGNVWSLSKVVGLKHDTAGVLRFVQVPD